jgi:hypothetical protein
VIEGNVGIRIGDDLFEAKPGAYVAKPPACPIA